MREDGPMNEHEHEPRWLKLAADLRAEPAPDTLARVRARLAAAARGRPPGLEPAWLRWLGRPAALATSLALLVACAWAGNAWVASSVNARPDGASVVSALLDEDGSFGLGLEADEAGSPSTSDSEAVGR